MTTSNRSSSLMLTAMICAGAVTAQFVGGKATRDALFLASLNYTALPAMAIATSATSVQTLGSRVVDSFFVRSTDGAKPCDPDLLVEVERALLHALSTPA